MCFAVWAQSDFGDETNGGLARLDAGHGAHTPGGSNPSTPGATPTTPSGGYSTGQPRNRTNATHRPDIRKGTFVAKIISNIKYNASSVDMCSARWNTVI